MPDHDPFGLARFVSAQEAVMPQVRAELAAGRKRTHWMWFVFPQVAGLGHSPTARHYAIASLAEARAYLAHPVLGPRLAECAALAAAVPGATARTVFGSPDDLKLHSSMTLFALADGDGAVFRRVLDRYYGGALDPATVALVGERPGLG